MNTAQKMLLILALALGVLIFAGEAYISRASSPDNVRINQEVPNSDDFVPRVRPTEETPEIRDESPPSVKPPQQRRQPYIQRPPYQQPQQQPRNWNYRRPGCGPNGCQPGNPGCGPGNQGMMPNGSYIIPQ